DRQVHEICYEGLNSDFSLESSTEYFVHSITTPIIIIYKNSSSIIIVCCCVPVSDLNPDVAECRESAQLLIALVHLPLLVFRLPCILWCVSCLRRVVAFWVKPGVLVVVVANSDTNLRMCNNISNASLVHYNYWCAYYPDTCHVGYICRSWDQLDNGHWVRDCKMFPLAKLAYYTCSEEERFFYDDLETLTIDIQPCCIDVIRYQQKKSTLNIGEYDIAVQFMDDEDYTMSEKAAASGHIMCLAFAEGCGFPWTRTVRARAAKNAINCRKNTRFRSFDNVVCKEAACNGQLECLVYLYNNGCLWDEDTCRAAAYKGHMDMLRYAHENHCPWDENTCRAAAEGGHMDMLRYAHENGCRWDENTCSAAAQKGHMDMLRYAHKNGCPWNESTCEAAAFYGHMELLRYAHENGCRWDENTCSAAAQKGHMDLLRYAHENG
ncbi:hypothetical protein AGLY_018279, partial [Aphis glycines]